MDEKYRRLDGRRACLYRGIHQDGQVVDAYLSHRRNAEAAENFFRRAIGETDVRPIRALPDKAKYYPPALKTPLPGAKHHSSKCLNNLLERDHGHLGQRLRPRRGFKSLARTGVVTRGYVFLENLRKGLSKPTVSALRHRRLGVAWLQLAASI